MSNNAPLLFFVTAFALVILAPFAYFYLLQLRLRQRMTSLMKQGNTRRQARYKIMELKPVPWELRLLVQSKYKTNDRYYTHEYLRKFSEKNFGTKPEQQGEPTL